MRARPAQRCGSTVRWARGLCVQTGWWSTSGGSSAGRQGARLLADSERGHTQTPPVECSQGVPPAGRSTQVHQRYGMPCPWRRPPRARGQLYGRRFLAVSTPGNTAREICEWKGQWLNLFATPLITCEGKPSCKLAKHHSRYERESTWARTAVVCVSSAAWT